jgi:hypothetical protein
LFPCIRQQNHPLHLPFPHTKHVWFLNVLCNFSISITPNVKISAQSVNHQ